MRKFAAVRQADILDKMFPHSLKLVSSLTSVDASLPPSQQVAVTTKTTIAELPCSVQSNLTTTGEVMNNQYILLCPYFEYKIPTDGSTLTLEVTIHGRTNEVSSNDIMSIENNYIYDVGDTPIGSKIKVVVTYGSWVF